MAPPAPPPPPERPPPPPPLDGGVDDLLDRIYPSHRLDYDERSLALYALALGAPPGRWTYEGHAAGFAPLPTFPAVPALAATRGIPFERFLPGFRRDREIHGEHYMELLHPLPPAGTLITRPLVVDVRDRGRAALLVARLETVEATTGHRIAVSELTSFALGAGGGGSISAPRPRPRGATERWPPPDRPPDVERTEAVSPRAAALYRLASNDLNPIHVDAAAAAAAGFPRGPILHGLCTLGIAARHLLEECGGGDAARLRSIKARFAAEVYPGDTLTVQMWRLPGGSRVAFRVIAAGRGPVVTDAGVVFGPPPGGGGGGGGGAKL